MTTTKTFTAGFDVTSDDVGKATIGESLNAHAYVLKLRRAQNEALDLALPSVVAGVEEINEGDHVLILNSLHVSWRIYIGEQVFEFNPQQKVPEGASRIECVMTVEDR